MKILNRRRIVGIAGLAAIAAIALLTVDFSVSAQPSPVSQVAALSAPSVVPVPATVTRDAEALSSAAHGQPDATNPGEIDVSSLRVLAVDVNGSGLTVAAGATNSGNVCLFISGGAEGCLTAFEGSTTVGWSILRAHPGDPVTVAGVAPDGVTSVAVDTSAGSFSSPVAANSFAVVLPTSIALSDIRSLDANGAAGSATIDIAPIAPHPDSASVR